MCASVSAVAPTDRIAAIDIIRGLTLFGVLIVNLITEFRVSIFQQFLRTTAPPGSVDSIVEQIISLAIESKAFCLFALLFGVGLAMQFDRLSRHGHSLYWLVRRLAVLLVFGLIHLLFIWNGDILTEYALAGFVTLPFLLVRSRVLLLTAAVSFFGLYAIGPLVLYAIPWPDAVTLQVHVTSANQVYSTGSAAEIWRFSLNELPLLLSLHAFVFPRTMAFFLFGIFLWRMGTVTHPRNFKSEIAIAAIVGVVVGATLTAADAKGSLAVFGALRNALAAMAPVLLAIGYGSSLLALTQLPITRKLLSIVAPMGRMAFTNYVLQSIVFGFIFFGYGLGQFGRLSATVALGIGVVVYIAQIILSKWWLHRFRFGPIEWLWRTLTYGAAPPMRKATENV